jgi:hypothetical protein
MRLRLNAIHQFANDAIRIRIVGFGLEVEQDPMPQHRQRNGTDVVV